jgi:hypothetical protein
VPDLFLLNNMLVKFTRGWLCIMVDFWSFVLYTISLCDCTPVCSFLFGAATNSTATF